MTKVTKLSPGRATFNINALEDEGGPVQAEPEEMAKSGLL